MRFLAGRLGCDPGTLARAVGGTRDLSAGLRRQVGVVYEALWDADPLAVGVPVRGYTLARRFAETHRFVPPAAWDDDVIDDPAAPTPLFVLDVSGPLSRQDKASEALMMQADRVPVQEAAHRLGYDNVASFARWCTRNGLDGSYSRYRDPRHPRLDGLDGGFDDEFEDSWAA